MRFLPPLVAVSFLIALAPNETLALNQVKQIEALPVVSPYESLRLANRDVATLVPKRQRYARYLTAGHERLAIERFKLWQGATWLVNHLSTARKLTPLYVLPDSMGSVFRVMLDDYKIDPKAWDDLAEKGSGPVVEARTPEGYYHLYQEVETFKTVEKEVEVPEGFIHTDGKRYTRKRIDEKVSQGKTTKLISLPALAVDGGGMIAETVLMTGTASPIVRADWWVYWAAQAPAYYQLLGLPKTLAEIEKFANVRIQEAEDNGAAVWAVVMDSNVALHNRRLRGYRVIRGPNGGAFWISDDVLSSNDERDLLSNPLAGKVDAHEIIFSLPNGLQGYAITDGKGVRLDVVNSAIALDRETKLRDNNLGIRNCMTCHLEGMRTIADEMRALANPKLTIAADERSAERIADLYFFVDVNVVTKRDSEQFQLTGLATNGLTAAANGANMEYLYRRYWDRPVTVEAFADELGCAPEQLIGAVQRPVVGNGVLASPVVYTQLDGLTRPNSRPLLRSQAEKIYGSASVLVGGKR